jgi:predicted nucleic acid-binding protein
MAGRADAARPIIGRSLYARAVFVDTAAFVALANTAEGDRHLAAVECLARIKAQRLPVLTSLPIVYETQRRLLLDVGSEAARVFVENIFDGSMRIARTLEQDEVEARKLIAKYPDLTLTDASGMAVMLRFGIAVCFTFDRHYVQAGFIRIPPFHL